MSDRSYPGAGGSTPDFEGKALSRSEYISAVVHFYRGELHRATLWRIRLDTTTNWAIISVMGLITFSLGGPTRSHVGILAGMALVTTFLWIEARRFRFFDVWRYRVRRIEENFYGPILHRDPVSPDMAWGDRVADDLLHPMFAVEFQHQTCQRRKCPLMSSSAEVLGSSRSSDPRSVLQRMDWHWFHLK